MTDKALLTKIYDDLGIQNVYISSVVSRLNDLRKRNIALIMQLRPLTDKAVQESETMPWDA